MTWRIEWSRLAERRLVELPWREAARVDAAVLHYTETGEGEIVRLQGDHAVTIRLRVGPTFVRISLDPFTGIMHVWTVYRR